MSALTGIFTGKPPKDVGRALQGGWWRSGQSFTQTPESTLADFRRLYGADYGTFRIDPAQQASAQAEALQGMSGAFGRERAGGAEEIGRGATGGLGEIITGQQASRESQAKSGATQQIMEMLVKQAQERQSGEMGDVMAQLQADRAGFERGEAGRRQANKKAVSDAIALIATIIGGMAAGPLGAGAGAGAGAAIGSGVGSLATR
ncbi:MAG: hypothetical protein ACREEP_13785 [Dongiaceae bacterium]